MRILIGAIPKRLSVAGYDLFNSNDRSDIEKGDPKTGSPFSLNETIVLELVTRLSAYACVTVLRDRRRPVHQPLAVCRSIRRTGSKRVVALVVSHAWPWC